MTNHWIDIKNANVILIMGSNAGENHPISFKWVLKAKKEGATLIHVDPRYTRTSALADFYTHLRPGTDIAFLGGMINYIIKNKKYFKEYVSEYTNASFIVNKKFDFKNGLFSGFNDKTHSYDKSFWKFELDENGVPKKDKSLKHPRCVFQLLKKHFSRYTLDKVSAVTGTPKEDLLKVYKIYSSTGVGNRAGTCMYAMGWTQHTVGVQNIRTMTIIQLLLGNIGISGGGVNALRGESNVQGSTDHAILFHILPGYLKVPKASMKDLETYLNKVTPKSSDPMSANWWGNYPKYMVSILKAFYGDNATKENDFCYNYLPKLDNKTNYSWLSLFDAMYREKIKGFFAWGQNPAVSGADAQKNRDAMEKLDWMVNVNIFENETGSFWKGPGKNPKKIKTEVFFLPCAVSVEKEGSITNSGRWMQWRYKAANPPNGLPGDGEIMVDLMNKIKELYKKDGGVFPEPILKLNWPNKYDSDKVAKIVNGYFMKDTVVKGKKFKKGDQVPSFAYLTDDGATCSGNWLYCNSYTNKGNMAKRRDKTQTDIQKNIGLFPKWAWCWPVNRRILYNRASVDLNGKPWNPDKTVIVWKNGKWHGDVPDGGWPPIATGKGRHPFIMRKHGFGQVFGPGRADGPFPEFYEPLESPVKKNLLNRQKSNPVVKTFNTPDDKYADYHKNPIVCTTFRLTEHWQSGILTRWQPWLVEAQPAVFIEISEELAKEKRIKNGEMVLVESPRANLKAVAMVTKRLAPMKIGKKKVHVAGLPWHFGWEVPKGGGDAANLLTPSVGDPNTMIPETKSFLVNIRKL